MVDRPPTPTAPSQQLLKIGEAATRSALSVKTVRYYCDEGLVIPASRSAGGYRLFDESVIEDLTQIRLLRSLDLHLEEIREIMNYRRHGHCSCSAMKSSLRSKVEEIRQRWQELQSLHEQLITMLNEWEECGLPVNSEPG